MMGVTAHVDVTVPDGDGVPETEAVVGHVGRPGQERRTEGHRDILHKNVATVDRGVANLEGRSIPHTGEVTMYVPFSLGLDRSRRRFPVSAVLALLLAACGGGAGAPTAAVAPPETSEAAWKSLATPRPDALDGAARVSVGQVDLIGPDGGALGATDDPGLGVLELVAAGLLRRRDVRFVERRRFAAAAEAERQGRTRPPGAPAAGVSEEPEWVLSVTWAPLGTGTATLEMRLADGRTGAIARSWRRETPADADAVSLARAIVGSLLDELDGLERRPAWADPIRGSAPAEYTPAGISQAATAAFFAGLLAEDAWKWDAAHRAYVEALDASPDFFEAQVALARTARLRMGGTLGES
jgi:hypothetical protein